MPLDIEEDSPRTHRLEQDEGDEDEEIQESPQNKRRRTERGKFPPGSILRVSLKNFVTYTNAEFYPGPNMNLVIGPNGSGKSTIVCAICLGLGYPPTVLGRATATGDYVQHGKESAEIELELADENDKTLTIKRKLSKEKNASTYYINGRKDTLNKVQEHMARFNIQIDNLCQFLPQDKVASFAQLSNTDLLKETQRAVGGAEMVNHWQNLCNKRKEEREIQTAIKNDSAQLSNLQQRQNAARPQVERIHKRNEIIANIDNIRIKIPLAKYSAARHEHMELKRQKQKIMEEVKKLEQVNAPMKKRKEGYEARKKATGDIAKRLETDLGTLLKKIKKCEGEFEEFDKKGSDFRTDIRSIQKAASNRTKVIQNLKVEIAKLERTVEHDEKKYREIAPDPSEASNLGEKIADISRQISPFNRKLREVNAEGQNAIAGRNEVSAEINRTQAELNDINSVQNRRLQGLKNPQNMDAYVAMNWLLKEGKQRFKKNVFGPPILYIGVKDKSLAAIAESCFRTSDLMTFTCLCREDYVKFCALTIDDEEKIFGRKLDLLVSNFSGTGKKLEDWRAPCSPAQLKNLGFDGFLKDILTGPSDVLNTLCHTNNIHTLAISKRAFHPNQNNAVESLTTPGPHGPQNVIEKYIAGNTRYELTRSKYGQRNVSTVTSTVYPNAKFLNDSIDEEKKKQLENELLSLKERYAEFQETAKAKEAEETRILTERKALEDKKNGYIARRAAIFNAKKAWETAQSRLETRTRELEAKENETDNSAEQIKRIEEKLQRNAHAWSYGKEALEMVDKIIAAKIQAIQAEADFTAVVKEADQSTKELQDALAELGRVDDEQLRKKDEAKTLFKEAQKIFKETGKSEDEMAELLASVTNDGVTVVALEEELAQQEASLRLHQNHNAAGFLEQYEKRQREIEEITARRDTRQAKADEITAEITRFRKVWEPRLERMIRHVSEVFGEAFKSIGCAGEVFLSKSGNENDPTETDDFEKWAVFVKVKFRETEKLQVLNSQRQSGGERSVSTIFYLMALQDMAKAPFRVVDEINQGMDPRNERLVHARMVDAACRPNTSQYFLITPKLLPGLKYHRNMKVLTINNGKFVPQELDISSIVQKVKALQA